MLRALPLAAGALGIAAVLLNRVVSGVRFGHRRVVSCWVSPQLCGTHASVVGAAPQIAPVVDASSSQSRADVLVIGLSAVLVLTGLQWLSVRPKPLTAVEPDAEYVAYVDPALPAPAQQELQWSGFHSILRAGPLLGSQLTLGGACMGAELHACRRVWQGLQAATPCRGVVVHHGGRCVMHCGMIRPGEQAGQATLGPICRAAMQSGRGNYLANLILFPGTLSQAYAVVPP